MKFAKLLCLIALLAQPVLGLSRQSDFSQPIYVQADNSEFNEASGVQILSGNVQITQGSMKILADKIVVGIDMGKLSTIEGTGSPILFEQEDEEGGIISGRCDRIEYDAKNARLTLVGNASLKQPNQELSGDRIVFDSKTQKVLAEGGENGRVNIKIQPPAEPSE
ncbi:MAG TPA: lipopolysaccharide transport periplasmic protein LptA [Gammaproteobacteria bacterium]|jgi:lipopolysaccharide export system protein LptA|nr:lipopolysaccharide transport periplasmic protein LptA [Gammaproteobacteria bacterium]